ncbi:amino acid adenylation domain-containing protein [Actinoplanes sp. KI2]|uniref:non-ribosomal peptide synthetase n=1 Tax=Actinoplanes sp. KI2 TaxID=2983315 RepID=UPI0021D5C982|nr:amino acid adenylation domain-containing protein [Actinoplanes sp. KI2]MCU7728828.1 amino acid adenylation domain-containing protein [Actinoplanes sp. KI2]
MATLMPTERESPAATVLPRWNGTGRAGATDVADIALGVPAGPAELLAAHAKVLAELSGDRDVVTALALAGRAPRSVSLRVGRASWAELVRQAAAVLDGEATAPAPAETELGEDRPDLPDGVVLRVSPTPSGLRLRYRTDCFDREHGARVAGYYATALELIHGTPDADHRHRTLLSAAELDLQINGLAGPERALPDRRCHEIFEDRVARTPDAIAAVHGDRSWTFADLNRRANAIARELIAQGLTAEQTVAVVTERNLTWMAGVLAVFKAGGAYVPIEPGFPADRIARTLARADCRLALADPAGAVALTAQPGIRVIRADQVSPAPADDRNLGLAIAADRLAYIYFTSGSTGEPKGAMCEHAGLVNHLFAKIDDLSLAEGEVLAQTAPQCFDISLWQLLAAPLAGGTTRIVGQDDILDVSRFVQVVAGGVDVVQLVPSYLEVVLTHLEENGGDLGRLRCVSATGEALKHELVERWFRAFPQITLVNAYGLTETSDDTNHEVMRSVPEGDRVPLGPAVNNVRVYVVDENLDPVPLGSPGEIVFSGVCVGRGYINDSERTAAVFGTDPHRPGERLYRSGDFGRWLPGGKLAFLGRRDAQVKIRGFRIELGEIENTLLRADGVRDGAVVVVERPGRERGLAAFYSGPREIPAAELRAHLSAGLPGYMVPDQLTWMATLPLTGNGKIDKKALGAVAAAAAEPDGAVAEPVTETERRIAAVWAQLLGLPPERVGRFSHFFESGGTSLSAVRMVVKLDRAVSLKELTRHPVLADLAAVIDGRRPDSTGLLQPLSEPAQPRATLVCFPYAGGNAVNFQPLATALEGSGIAVYAVELPGHDLTAEPEPFVSAAQAAKTAAAEIVQRCAGPVLLWGHSSGAATAVLAGRLLEEQDADLRAVLVGAQLVGDEAERRRFLATLSELDDREITARLSRAGAYTELGEVDDARAALVGAAYRHDVREATEFFLDVLTGAPVPRLGAPLFLVLAADDPATSGHEADLPAWRRLAGPVRVRVLPDGGHYFPRTRADRAAAEVRAVAQLCNQDRSACS